MTTLSMYYLLLGDAAGSAVAACVRLGLEQYSSKRKGLLSQSGQSRTGKY
jgi:hypothetical protein